MPTPCSALAGRTPFAGNRPEPCGVETLEDCAWQHAPVGSDARSGQALHLAASQ